MNLKKLDFASNFWVLIIHPSKSEPNCIRIHNSMEYVAFNQQSLISNCFLWQKLAITERGLGLGHGAKTYKEVLGKWVFVSLLGFGPHSRRIDTVFTFTMWSLFKSGKQAVTLIVCNFHIPMVHYHELGKPARKHRTASCH